MGSAFSPSIQNQQQTSSAVVSRGEFFKKVALVATTAGVASFNNVMPALAEEERTLDNGVKIVVKKTGKGRKTKVGELAGIRFAAYANGSMKIDDIFDTPEPYYTRVGAGGLIKGVEDVLPMMKNGDRWELTVPPKLAFGDQGRPASAGKPRIPAGAVITFDVEIVALPGDEEELIDVIGD